MAGFKRVSGADRGFERFDASSLTASIGDVFVFDRSNHIVIKATSSTSLEDLAGVAVEDTVAASSILLQRITGDDEFVINTTNNSSATHNYQRMVLTDENEVNNTGTDSTSDAAIFMQLAPVGAAADKKIRGRFNINVDRA